jgi:hypothetical protein
MATGSAWQLPPEITSPSAANTNGLSDTHSTARREVAAQPASTRKPRQLTVYKNPKTVEVIETKGGNHRVLKKWKEEHGADVVEGWLRK